MTTDERPCSSCGSAKRIPHVFIFEVARAPSLKGEVRNQTGKITRKFYAKSKISKRGKEAKEELTIDIAGNRKFHHVEEQDKNGHWDTVNHEDEPLRGKKKHHNK